MANRTNWTAIRTYYLAHETETLRTVSDHFNLNYGSIRQMASDGKWSKQKQKIKEQALSRINERTTDLIVQKTEEQLVLAQAILGKAAEMLAKGVTPTTPSQVRSWIETGIQIQRNALNMDSKEGSRMREKFPNWRREPERVQILH